MTLMKPDENTEALRALTESLESIVEYAETAYYVSNGELASSLFKLQHTIDQLYRRTKFFSLQFEAYKTELSSKKPALEESDAKDLKQVTTDLDASKLVAEEAALWLTSKEGQRMLLERLAAAKAKEVTDSLAKLTHVPILDS